MSTKCIRAQKSPKQGVDTPCELLGKISYGTRRLDEQSPEIQLGCMRGLGGSEQPAPSEAF